MNSVLPRILVVDDLFGRELPGVANRERENLCGKFLLAEEPRTDSDDTPPFEISDPLARVVFCRGQLPTISGVGATVENDLPGTIETIRKGWTGAVQKGDMPWSLLLLDLCFYTGRVTEESNRRTRCMPEGRPSDDNPNAYFGLTLLDAIHREFPELPIFVLSSKPREAVSLEFSRRGALGFIDRGHSRGPELLRDALWQHGLVADSSGEIVGFSIPVLLALREARRAARHRENLLIRGERGTGKEVLAGYIHRVGSDEIWAKQDDNAGAKRYSPFVTVNSAVLTPNLFASELFGIQPRTATGVDGKVGLIEIAKGGDLFLDEIADTPPEVQAALLRVLQERKIIRVGAREPLDVDVRFISATNSDVEEAVKGFRLDLLDRLRLGGTIWLPPLRDRRTDIPILTRRFVVEAENARRGILTREITAEAMEKLIANEWSGNIRELRACLFDAVNRHPDVEHLVPEHLRLATDLTRKAGTSPSQSEIKPGYLERARGGDSLPALLAIQAGVHFDPRNIAQWSGRLEDLRRGQTWLLARYLQAALDATKRRTPLHPDGLIQIHPAVKLITGDSSMTASKAADIIKRILGPLNDELQGDLREALDIAVRLRPRTPKNSSTAI